MSLPRIRDEWHVPARVGQSVTVAHLGLTGVITGCMEYGGLDYVTVTVQDELYDRVHIRPNRLTYPKAGQ